MDSSVHQMTVESNIQFSPPFQVTPELVLAGVDKTHNLHRHPAYMKPVSLTIFHCVLTLSALRSARRVHMGCA